MKIILGTAMVLGAVITLGISSPAGAIVTQPTAHQSDSSNVTLARHGHRGWGGYYGGPGYYYGGPGYYYGGPVYDAPSLCVGPLCLF